MDPRTTKTLRKIESLDRRLGFAVIMTCIILIALTILTLINVMRVNGQLQTQVEQHRSETEQTIDKINKENEHSHDELLRFTKCILLLQPETRSVESIDKCVEESQIRVEEFEGGQDSDDSSFNNTPNEQPSSATNPTNPQEVTQSSVQAESQPSAQQQETTPPSEKEPEQPEEPLPPSPASIIERIIDIIRAML